MKSFKIGDKVICYENGIVGNVITGIDLASSPDQSANALTPYGKYLLAFSRNHGITISEACEHPMVKARLNVFSATGR